MLSGPYARALGTVSEALEGALMSHPVLIIPTKVEVLIPTFAYCEASD